MTDTPAAPAPRAPRRPPTRRSTRAEIASAIDLGWRVAALHALSPTTLRGAVAGQRRHAAQPPQPVGPRSRGPRGAGHRGRRVARRRGDRAARARPAARARDGLGRLGGGRAGVSRRSSRSQHIEFDKRLWAADEPSGKAYELGNFLSDTWNRVAAPARAPGPAQRAARDLQPDARAAHEAPARRPAGARRPGRRAHRRDAPRPVARPGDQGAGRAAARGRPPSVRGGGRRERSSPSSARRSSGARC